jgi:hypothetical protein
VQVAPVGPIGHAMSHGLAEALPVPRWSYPQAGNFAWPADSLLTDKVIIGRAAIDSIVEGGTWQDAAC